MSDAWASTNSQAPWFGRRLPDASTAPSSLDRRLKRSHQGERTRASSVTTSSSLSPVESWSEGHAYQGDLRLHQRPIALTLTDRQMEMLALAAHGMTDKQIAHRLALGVSTVKNTIATACASLGVQGRLGAFYVLGWLHPPMEVVA